MERNEMIEVLIEKANISREEAEEVLEKCNGDILDAIVYLERIGKIQKDKTTIIEPEEDDYKEGKREENKCKNEKFGGIGEVIGKIFRFIGKFIKKGNENFFEVRKKGEKPIRISLTISVLLLIFLTVPTLALLVIGLFCGYKYSISGKSFKCEGVNSVFEGASKSADNIKRDFKAGYEE